MIIRGNMIGWLPSSHNHIFFWSVCITVWKFTKWTNNLQPGLARRCIKSTRTTSTHLESVIPIRKNISFGYWLILVLVLLHMGITLKDFSLFHFLLHFMTSVEFLKNHIKYHHSSISFSLIIKYFRVIETK